MSTQKAGPSRCHTEAPAEARTPGSIEHEKKVVAFTMAERRARVAGLYLAGKRQTEIAEAIGVSQPTICADLKAIQAEWAEKRVDMIDTYKSRELARIGETERRAWEQFDRSCLDAEAELDEESSGEDGTRKRKQRTRKPQCGDPRYLSLVLDTVDKRCKLLGLYAPTKVAPTNPEGDKEYQETFHRDELIRKWQAIRDRRREAAERDAAATEADKGSDTAVDEANAASGSVSSDVGQSSRRVEL